MTGGMLLLVYSLVRAPMVGWGSIQTIATLDRLGCLAAGVRLSTSCEAAYPLLPLPFCG